MYSEYIYKKYTFGTDRIIRKAEKELIRLRKAGPFMLFINFMEAHLPYCPPEKALKQILPQDVSLKEVRDVNLDVIKYITGMVPMAENDFRKLKLLYQAEVNYLDQCLGRLFKLIKKLGIYDKSMIIIMSDHGENLGEHGLMGHQFCLSETLLKIPLIIKYPQREFMGENNELVENIDIFPTILDEIEIQDQDALKWIQGISLKDQAALMERRSCYSEYYDMSPSREKLSSVNPDFNPESVDETLVAVMEREWKYIKHGKKKNELFNIQSDPEELKNMIDEMKIDHWERQIELMPKSEVESAGKKNYDFEPEIAKSLKALGYI